MKVSELICKREQICLIEEIGREKRDEDRGRGRGEKR